MEPIRVLQVIGGMNFGGAENFLMNMYRNIDRTKVQFDFLVNRKGVFDDEIKELGGNVYYIPALQKVGPIIYVHNLKNFLNNNNYSIVHSHLNQVTGLILETAKKCGVKVRIAHCHSSSNSSYNFITRIYKNYLNTKINKNATIFFACSEIAAQWLFKEKANEAIIIKNAIDIDRFKFNEEKRKLIRKELKINENEIVVGHVGRFSTVKNHKFLIEIFNEFQKNNENTKLLLVGDGPLRNEIENQTAELNITDKVILVGNKKNVEDYYNAMDLFVFPSLYEGLPLTVIEAQINGLSCYLSDTISREVDITSSICFISLSSSIKKVWIKYMNSFSKERLDNLNKIKDKGYDIKEIVKLLENVYLNL